MNRFNKVLYLIMGAALLALAQNPQNEYKQNDPKQDAAKQDAAKQDAAKRGGKRGFRGGAVRRPAQRRCRGSGPALGRGRRAVRRRADAPRRPGRGALARGGGEEIPLDEIETELTAHAPPNEPLVKQDLLALPLREAREQFERAYLQQQLLLCNGKVGQLAKRVGMERTHLYRKLRSLGVEFRPSTDE